MSKYTMEQRRKAVVWTALVALVVGGLATVAFLSPALVDPVPTLSANEPTTVVENSSRQLRFGAPKPSLADAVASRLDLHYFEAALVSTGRLNLLEANERRTVFATVDDFWKNNEQQELKKRLTEAPWKAHLVSSRL